MDVRTYQDPERFRALATPFYGKDTLRHTVALTVMGRFLGSEGSTTAKMATLHDDQGDLIGVALRTPPWPMIVSGLPTDPVLLDEFVTQWFEFDPETPGANGPLENVDAVRAAWVRRVGGATHQKMANRLFKLGELVPPAVSGSARAATADDFELLVGWYRDFAIEAMGYLRDPEGVAPSVRRALTMGDSCFLWEDGGKPVAWAVASAPINGMSRIGPVYTPPEHREHGYGSAVTAAVSQGARDAGATDVILFTDLANPTSNSIYQKIGYRPVYDSAEWEFGQLPSTT